MSLLRLVNSKYLLVLICIFFLATRLYKISEVPSSVYWDEASIGYNAYSIAETGKDEWGKSFPLHFRAFGEFKLPVYIYSAVPFVKIFGLNAFSVRIPAVLFSLGVILLTYLLAKKLSGNDLIGLIGSFFVSISPWFFIFSRTGYEATAGLMFYVLAVYLFLEFEKNTWVILFSIISFILSAYSYNSFRIIIPITILILIAFHFHSLKSILRKNFLPVILSVFILILSVIPIYRLYVYDSGASRLQAVGAAKTSIIQNYFSHFSLNFLFISGDKNLRSQQEGFGQLYLLDLLFLPMGFLFFLKSKFRYKFLPLILLLLGPVPAAITKEVPHALRSISVVPFISIMSAAGVVYVLKYINRNFLSVIAIIVYLILFTGYFLNFISVYPIQASEDWQYGYQQIFTGLKNDFSKYDHVVISDEYAQPYIFALFYQKIDPKSFRQSVVRNSVDQWGFSTVSGFDKFEFGKINKFTNLKLGSSLIFASNENPLDPSLSGTIRFQDGKTAFWIYENK